MIKRLYGADALSRFYNELAEALHALPWVDNYFSLAESSRIPVKQPEQNTLTDGYLCGEPGGTYTIVEPNDNLGNFGFTRTTQLFKRASSGSLNFMVDCVFWVNTSRTTPLTKLDLVQEVLTLVEYMSLSSGSIKFNTAQLDNLEVSRIFRQALDIDQYLMHPYAGFFITFDVSNLLTTTCYAWNTS